MVWPCGGGRQEGGGKGVEYRRGEEVWIASSSATGDNRKNGEQGGSGQEIDRHTNRQTGDIQEGKMQQTARIEIDTGMNYVSRKGLDNA